ncbi:MAG: DNA mismatch repair protein MutS [candidate division Zixibacteria bacterium]|nr:DNA mismatch repair protein MutS [candidate division Zixibacteria bacterium]
MAQYARMKAQHPDAILFFRMGDFYETFNEDARTISKVLGITLTARNHGDRTPLAGVPHHAVEKYIAELVRSGYKVAVCEQTEDPKKAKGVVKRDVVEVITPGTSLLAQTLEAGENNYIVGLVAGHDRWGVAFVDLSTGEFHVAEMDEPQLLSELNRLQPSEAVVAEDWEESARHLLVPRFPVITFSRIDGDNFLYDQASRTLQEHFEVLSLKGFGCEDLVAGVAAAGGLLSYLKDTQKNRLAHLKILSRYDTGAWMMMDPATQRNLELTLSLRDSSREGTLLSVMDRTRTSMGARFLRNALMRPLVSVSAIRLRQHAVRELVDRPNMRDRLSELLGNAGDIERLAARVGSERANARDLSALRETLRLIPVIKSALADARSESIASLVGQLHDMTELADQLEKAIVDAPPLSLTEGGFIRAGYHAELDELRDICSNGKQWIARLQQQERDRTGIQSLKVDYNRVFGYYIEVTHANLHRLTGDYVRKQTMRNAERFITPELKEYEEKILGAEERIMTLEYELFQTLRAEVAKYLDLILSNGRALAFLDFLRSLADVAVRNDYTAPEIDDEMAIVIRDGRHPVVEQLLQGEPFVPNDVHLDTQSQQIGLITGPNMAGKSTYLRQTGLIVLMAQIGSFVPARSAHIGLVDRIFTRVGASDNLAHGESTFLVEMNETANILNNATPKSLILLDEIGRGTSTFDGLSLAWAITEYLHDTASRAAKTLFATHYHELIELETRLSRVRNYNVAIRERDDHLVFLRKVLPGGSDRSYGIQVARLAGLPAPVLERAKTILTHLESEDMTPAGTSHHARPRPVENTYQLSLFMPQDHPVVESLRQLDINGMTPLEALNTLHGLQRQATGKA